MTPRVLFLPGARGAAAFWHPVGERLPGGWAKRYLSWPGLGSEPPDPAVRGLDDLVGLVEQELAPCTDLVAQSMGGVVAVRVALKHPETIGRLVLVATSGGVDVAGVGGADWRGGYRRANPTASTWITEDVSDHTREIPSIGAPTLLLWGDAGLISPVAVGERLASLLPKAELRIVAVVITGWRWSTPPRWPPRSRRTCRAQMTELWEPPCLRTLPARRANGPYGSMSPTWRRIASESE